MDECLQAFHWTIQQFEETGYFTLSKYLAYLNKKSKNTIIIGGKAYRKASPDRAKELA